MASGFPTGTSVAFDVARTEHPDLIAIGYDPNFRATDSLNLVHRLRADPITYDVPILLVGSVEDRHLPQLVDEGVGDAWMTVPPSDISVVIDLLNRLTRV